MRLEDSEPSEGTDTSPGGSPFTDILEAVYNAGHFDGRWSTPDKTVHTFTEERDVWEQALLQVLAEAIGKDEPREGNEANEYNMWMTGRNQLRYEIRTALGINGEGKPHGDSK